MKSYAVFGAGFGDEGKGLVTSHLCSQCEEPLVVRFSGGHQSGHHVVLDDGRKHVFANFGSGTLQGVATYWSKDCTVDPIGLVNELSVLREKGADPKLYLDRQCPVTTPYDLNHNRGSARALAHGTCGVGFGATMQRQADRYCLTVGDLLIASVLEIKLELIQQYYGTDAALECFLHCCKTLVASKNIMITDGMPQGSHRTLIFEGSQGLLLDQDIGFFPHVTRAHTGARNILQIGFRPRVYLVTRAYQVRHGNGPMTNEDLPHNIRENPFEQNHTNPFQGRLRRSLLDLDMLQYAIGRDAYIRAAKEKTLVITCLDLVRNEYRYTLGREIKYCRDENEFVAQVAGHLEIGNVLVSKSPCSAGIKKFQMQGRKSDADCGDRFGHDQQPGFCF